LKPHLRLASLIFNQPQLVTDPMMSLAVQWANQALNLNIVNLTVNGVQPKIMEDDEFDSGAQMAAASGVAVSWWPIPVWTSFRCRESWCPARRT
jgi:hypothetical protein